MERYPFVYFSGVRGGERAAHFTLLSLTMGGYKLENKMRKWENFRILGEPP